ncbi:hypothetical protein GCM10010499_22070 [Streptomyces thermoviolaceus subsp. apingens]|nr:hypothetical protein GCM10010499_22070 [Streptomyces thermoviolaceus subsp. apingens]
MGDGPVSCSGPSPRHPAAGRVPPHPYVLPPHPYVLPPHPYVLPPHPDVPPPHPDVPPPHPDVLPGARGQAAAAGAVSAGRAHVGVRKPPEAAAQPTAIIRG